MFNPEKHPYFEKYVDPQTRVVSYILKERVAEVQMNLYFTEQGVTDDGKYLWFRCMYPPATYTHLAVMSLDCDNPFIRSFPHVQMIEQPCVIPGTHDLLTAIENKVYRVDTEGNMTKVIEVGEDIIRNRRILQLSTHLSINSEGELVLLDMSVGNKTYIATGNLKTGDVKLIHKFVRYYDHAQFSPHDPKLFLIDEDWEIDPITGERFDVDVRMWLMDTDATKLEPLLPGNWFKHNNSIICHDFWSADGYICWPDLVDNVYEYNLQTKEVNLVWNHTICHCHTLDRMYWVGDDTPYGWENKPCRVVFFDRQSGKEIDIFSNMPHPPCRLENGYHMDPHPAFTRDGKFITSMTTVRDGKVDFAITPVEPLIELCRKNGIQVNEPLKK